MLLCAIGYIEGKLGPVARGEREAAPTGGNASRAWAVARHCCPSGSTSRITNCAPAVLAYGANADRVSGAVSFRVATADAHGGCCWPRIVPKTQSYCDISVIRSFAASERCWTNSFHTLNFLWVSLSLFWKLCAVEAPRLQDAKACSLYRLGST